MKEIKTTRAGGTVTRRLDLTREVLIKLLEGQGVSIAEPERFGAYVVTPGACDCFGVLLDIPEDVDAAYIEWYEDAR